MKKILSFLALILCALGTWAQSWSGQVPTTGQYPNETVVYAKLSQNLAELSTSTIRSFTIGAFVNGECRASGRASNAGTNNGGEYYWTLRVYGDLSMERDADITFKLYYGETGAEYDLTPEKTIKFDGESVQYPSDAITLSLTAATSYTLNYFEVDLGKTVNLLDYLTVEPEGAAIPTNHTWNLGNDVNSGTITDDELTAGPQTGDAMLYLYAGAQQLRLAFGTFRVIQHATSIETSSDVIEVEKGETESLGVALMNAYTLNPEDATDEVKWRVDDETIVSYNPEAGGSSMAFEALKGGETTVWPYIEYTDADGKTVTIEPEHGITVRVIAHVESVEALTTSMYANVGDDITERLTQYFNVLPEDATNKNLIFTSSNEEYLSVSEDGKVTANKRPAINNAIYIIATSEDNPEATATIRVYISDWSKELSFVNNPLTVTINSRGEDVDIYDKIIENLVFEKENYHVDFLSSTSTNVKLGSSNNYVQNTVERGYYKYCSITASEEGTTDLNLRLMYDDYSNASPSKNPQIFIVKYTLTVNVVVDIPVTDLELSDQVLHANVGDDITERLNALVTVVPEDATDKTLTWTNIDQADVVTVADDGTITAATAGSTTLMVYAKNPAEALDRKSITVYVHNPVKEMAFYDNPLNVTINTTYDATNITSEIISNLNYEGSETDNEVFSISLADATNPVVWMASIEDESEKIEEIDIHSDPEGWIYTQQKGTATLNVNYSWTDYSSTDAEGNFTVVTRSASFVVNVTEDIPLESFDFVVEEGAAGEASIATLTPSPDNATYNASDVTVTVYPNNGYSEGVTVSKEKNDDNQLVVTITAELPGWYDIQATAEVEGDEMNLIENGYFEVPDKIELPAGWSWRSNPYGTVSTEPEDGETAFTDFFGGDALYEIRTQDDLLINDPNWGYFGSLTLINQSQMYKVKMNQAQTSLLYGGFAEINDFGENYSLYPNGYTYVGSPYFFSYSLNGSLTDNIDPVEGMIIISKEDGSAEFADGEWTGDLEVLNNREGYLVFNPTEEEYELPFPPEANIIENKTASVKARAKARLSHREQVWNYDPSQFMNNMTMVATLPEIDNLDEFTLGAFVDGECRGEGRLVKGKFFVTVHTNGGEEVSFQLYNYETGEYFDIDQTVATQQRVGSVKRPVELTSHAWATGISSIASGNLDADGTEIYNLNGIRLNNLQKGVNIIRQTDGSVRKVFVK